MTHRTHSATATVTDGVTASRDRTKLQLFRDLKFALDKPKLPLVPHREIMWWTEEEFEDGSAEITVMYLHSETQYLRTRDVTTSQYALTESWIKASSDSQFALANTIKIKLNSDVKIELHNKNILGE